MKNLEYFERFVIKKPTIKDLEIVNAITYTRVSTKDQVLNGSLATQEKMVKTFCKKHGFSIIKEFGKTYESAKTDERKELTKLIEFVVKSRNTSTPVHVLIVAFMDRFSRSENNIDLYNRINSYGVTVIDANDGTIPVGATGKYFHKMKLVQSNYDNELRKERCGAGIRDMILRGEYPGQAPFGYTKRGPKVKDPSRISFKQVTEVNEDGKKLRKAWKLKVQGRSDSYILRYLKSLNVCISKQKLSAIWRNPFYCGIYVSKFVDRPVAGKWEAIVSEEDFRYVNEILDGKNSGYTVLKYEENRPLQGFILCPVCNNKFTGYKSKKTSTHYYKCNTASCEGGNVNAETTKKSIKRGAHDLFRDMLTHYQLSEQLIPLYKKQLKATFIEINDSNIREKKELKKQLSLTEQKIENLYEKFMEGDIPKEYFVKFMNKQEDEKKLLLEEIEKREQSLSNLTEYIDFAVLISSMLSDLWDCSNYEDKLLLQKTIFPDKIFYDKKNHQYRTSEMNTALKVIRSFTEEKEGQKKGRINKNTDSSGLVAGAGLEPATFGL